MPRRRLTRAEHARAWCALARSRAAAPGDARSLAAHAGELLALLEQASDDHARVLCAGALDPRCCEADGADRAVLALRARRAHFGRDDDPGLERAIGELLRGQRERARRARDRVAALTLGVDRARDGARVRHATWALAGALAHALETAARAERRIDPDLAQILAQEADGLRARADAALTEGALEGCSVLVLTTSDALADRLAEAGAYVMHARSVAEARALLASIVADVVACDTEESAGAVSDLARGAAIVVLRDRSAVGSSAPEVDEALASHVLEAIARSSARSH